MIHSIKPDKNEDWIMEYNDDGTPAVIWRGKDIDATIQALTTTHGE